MKTSPMNYEKLRGLSRKDILKQFIKRIEPKGSWKSHLKVYIIRVSDFSPAKILPYLKKELFENKSGILESYMDKFKISTESLNQEEHIDHLKFEELRTRKKIHFIIFGDEKYWHVITLAKKKDADKTFVSLIKKIPHLTALDITTSDLENLIASQEYTNNIIGFTARYDPYKIPREKKKKRKITIDVYGGDLIDLASIRQIFFVEPRTFQFSLQNSPADAIEGKIFHEGYFTMKFVKPGSEVFAIDTISKLSQSFEEIDQLYLESEKYKNAPTSLEEGKGLVFDSFYSIVIKIKKDRIQNGSVDNNRDQTTFENINRKLVEFFQNKHQYSIYSETEYSHFVIDRYYRSQVQIAVEPQDYNIVIYPMNKCSSISLREICNNINHVENSFESKVAFIMN